MPEQVDLRKYCSPIEDQEDLGSCTAQAVAGLVEYFENRTQGQFLDASRLFLYKVTRKLYGFQGDSGAYIRGTIRALRIFGACPEDCLFTFASASQLLSAGRGRRGANSPVSRGNI